MSKQYLYFFLMLLILISGWIGSCGDDPPEPLPVTTLVITTVDEDGAFIQGVKVNLYRTIPDWISETSPALEEKITDETGKVVYTDPDSGKYYIDAQKGLLNNWEEGVIKTVVEDLENTTNILVVESQSGLLASVAGKKWILSSYFSNGSDAYDFLDDCVKDDLLIFFKGPGSGKFTLLDETNLCNSNGETSLAGVWKIDSNENALEIQTTNTLVSWKLVELDSVNLKVSFMKSGNNIEAGYIAVE